ncbi:MAG: hypothetical protein GY757_53695 [bacterium]|nr:hypothetical protein [bacterium]
MADNIPEKSSGNLTNNSNGVAKDIPIIDLVELRNKGLTFDQIGRLVGCSKQNVSERLRSYATDLRGLKTFKAHRADIYALFVKKMLYSLTVADIKRMAPDRRVWSAAVLHDKEMGLRGQMVPTNNYIQIVNKVEGLEAKEIKIKAAIAELTG